MRGEGRDGASSAVFAGSCPNTDSQGSRIPASKHWGPRPVSVGGTEAGPWAQRRLPEAAPSLFVWLSVFLFFLLFCFLFLLLN